MTTVSEAFNVIVISLEAAFSWFMQIFTGEWWVLICGAITFVIFSRLILNPLFGASDKVKGKGDTEE